MRTFFGSRRHRSARSASARGSGRPGRLNFRSSRRRSPSPSVADSDSTRSSHIFSSEPNYIIEPRE